MADMKKDYDDLIIFNLYQKEILEPKEWNVCSLIVLIQKQFFLN